MTTKEEIIFFDVDTQNDFMNQDGKLYVSGAESIKENLGKLTQYARMQDIRILGSVDFHSLEDSEIEPEKPDYSETFPPHCMQNSTGQEKISETRSDIANWIDSVEYSKEKIKEIVSSKGPIFFRKDNFDAFSNPNSRTILKTLKPKKVVVYGVAIDYCVKSAVDGFLNLKDQDIFLVVDAVEGIEEEKSKNLIKEWVEKGVRTVTTEGILQGALLE
ncbi:MAG: cysteine hydrolase family protein [Candidatus Heimdallarchaeaceae archaeon]|jgi:nicotinamidase/pyrazinamidase